MRKTLTLFIASLLAMPNFANDRSEEEMQTIAQQALCASNLQAGGARRLQPILPLRNISH